MDHREPRRQTLQALGVPEKKKTARHQTICKPVHKFSLLFSIEIDHHVAAENYVETAQTVVIFQVVIVENDTLSNAFVHHIMTIMLFEVPGHPSLVDTLQLVRSIESVLRSFKCRERKIRCEYSDHPRLEIGQTFKQRHHRTVR